MTQKEQTVLDHLHVAHNVASKYASRFHVSLDEARSHAEFALTLLVYEEKTGWDPDKGSLEKWLWVKLNWYLLEVYHRGNHPHHPELKEPASFREIHNTDMINEWDTEDTRSVPDSMVVKDRDSWLHKFLEEIGQEGAEVVHIILNAPVDLMDELCACTGRSSKHKRNNLRSYLIDVLDWTPERVALAFEEVEACL